MTSKARKRSAAKGFPQVIYVQRDGEGEESYLVASATIDEVQVEDGPTTVARYQLVEVGEVVALREYKKA